MITRKQMFDFLVQHYRPSRFQLHSDSEKADRVCDMYIEDLEKYGVAHVSRHEDNKMQGFKFTKELVPIYGKHVEYPSNFGHLTHLF